MLCFLSVLTLLSIGWADQRGAFADDWRRIKSPDENPELDDIFTSLGSSKLYVRPIDLDENHLHSCFEYKLINTDSVISHSNTFCMPLIVVAGIRKCSTSAMYNLLAQYPNALRIPNKENCVMHYSNIIEYFISLPTHIDKGEIFMDGCIEPPSNSYVRKLLGSLNTFYLVTTRDYADWVWSAYNYWCNKDYDGDCPRKTVDVATCKRSPELLHNIVLARLNGQRPKTPLAVAGRPCVGAEKRYAKIISDYWSNFPVQDTLIVASEDLEENPQQVWTRIALSIGLNTSHPHIREFESVRYNVQADSRNTTGFMKTVNASTFQPGLYEVSGYKPMLQETAEIIRKCWVNDCVYTSIVTRHMYDACKSEATKQNARLSQYLSYSITDTTQKASATRYMASITALEKGETDKYTPFIARIKDDKCARAFDSVTKGVAASSRDSKKAASASGSNVNAGGSTSAKKGHTSPSTAGSASIAGAESHVVILTTSSEDAEYLEELLHFSTLGAARVYNTLPHTSIGATSRLKESSVKSLCSSSGGGGLPVIVIAHPATIFKTDHAIPVDREIGHKEALSFAFTLNITLLNSRSSVDSNSRVLDRESVQCLTSLLFNKVVVITADLLTNLWAAYLKRYEFDAGLTESMLYRFNWNKWDNEALDILKNLTSSETLAADADQEDVYWNSAHLAPLVGGIGCDTMPASNATTAAAAAAAPAAPAMVSQNKLSAITPLLDMTITPDYHQKSSVNQELDSTLVMVSREDLMYSESRVSVLKQLLDFVSPSVRSTSNALFNTSALALEGAAGSALDHLRCAYTETVLDSVEDRYNHLRLSKHIHLAFTNEALVCALRHFVQHEISEHSGGRLSPNSPEFSLLDTLPVSCKPEASSVAAAAAASTAAIPSAIVHLTPSQLSNCKARYLDSSIRPTPTSTGYVLLGNAGPHIVSVRLLLEHGTGVLTGSVLANKNMSQALEGEEVCSFTQSVVFLPANTATVSRLVTIRERRRLTPVGVKHSPGIRIPGNAAANNAKSIVVGSANDAVVAAATAAAAVAPTGAPRLKLKPKARPVPVNANYENHAAVNNPGFSYNITTKSSKDMRRCNANGVKGFGRGIIVIEDPFVALYKEYQKKPLKAGASEAEVQSAVMAIFQHADFSQLINFPLDLLESMVKAPSIDHQDYRLLSAEVLLLPYATGLLAASNKQVVMKQLSLFLNIPKPFQERLDCMYSFLPNYHAQAQLVEEAAAFFASLPDLICAVNSEFNRKLTFDGHSVLFRHYRLFADASCK